jgi:hypothetical protein
MAYYSAKLWGKKRVLNMEAFIAPAKFDANAQPLNIITVFGEYNNANKAYIYSFTSAIATLTLPASAGITYRWGETISGVDYVYDVVSGTAFTAGSTKRYVIVNSTATSLIANVANHSGYNGAIWIYCSSKVYGIYAYENTYLNYVHCEDLNSITTIGINAFYGCKGLTGTLTIPNSVTTIGNQAFANCKGLTGSLTIPNSVTTIGDGAFQSCNKLNGIATIGSGITTIGYSGFYPIPLVTEWHILSLVAPSVQINTWGNYAKPLHVKIGATGYNVAPFTNTEIFSSIIYDL